jgi:aspartate carbamoyltransferase catalytic subunit
LANLKEKSSRTTSEFSVIDKKLSSSIVKLAGRNENPEMF